MNTTKAPTLTVQLMQAVARIAQLEERIAKLEAAPVAATRPIALKPEPVITRYYDRAGQLWEKTRIGNQARSRLVTQ